MFQTSLENMLKFTPDGLIGIFLDQYIYENGEKKSKNILNTVQSSPKVLNYLQRLDNMNGAPYYKDIQSLMNSIPYFIFSKGETLCLGGLFTILYWRNHVDSIFKRSDDAATVKTCSELIIACDKTKFHTSENLFDRFYIILEKIADEEFPNTKPRRITPYNIEGLDPA